MILQKPEPGSTKVYQQLQLLAINLTERCNMACAHCYLDAKTLSAGSSNELTFDEVCKVLNSVACRNNDTMVVLTGGEPLLRQDLELIIRHGSDLGLSIVVGTNGSALSLKRAQSLKKAGLLGVGISIDSLQQEKHDIFRGLKGSWQKTMQGIDACRKIGLSFQLHFTVTQKNQDEIKDLAQFACDSGARVLNFFFLVCTGRGQSIQDIDAETYEKSLAEIISLQKDYPEMIIRARCAPHYKRLAHQMNPLSNLNKISGMQGDGCIAGIHYARVSPSGDVTACPYIEKAVGNIRETDFWQLWDESTEFKQLRDPQLTGRCGVCEYRQLCGGCRARPMAAEGKLMAEDQFCQYQPQGGEVIKPAEDNQYSDIFWSGEAQKRLQNIPGFLQRIIKQRAEAYVADLGESCVTAEHLHQLAAKRFGNKKPSFGGDEHKRPAP